MQENILKNYSNDRFIHLNTFTCRRLFFHSQKVVAGFYFSGISFNNQGCNPTPIVIPIFIFIFVGHKVTRI